MRKLMSVVAGAAILMLSVNPVCAGEAPAAPVAAAAPAITPAKQALLARLDKAMNFEKMMKDVMGPAMTSSVEGMRQILPEMTAEDSNTLATVTVQVMERYMPKLKEITFQAYAEVLSEAELTAMVEFYETPEGQVILAKTPQVTQRSMAQMSGIGVQMQKDMILAICEKKKCPQTLIDRVKS